MNIPPSFSDPSWLFDMEDITPDRWRSLIYCQLLEQRNVFVNDFKLKVIKTIDDVMANINPQETMDKLHSDLLNKFKEQKYDTEYYTFVEGIISTTFEFVCQYIIKNSFENIKRTQIALNSSSTLNNDGVSKECYNKNSKESESSKTFQVYGSSESNNNTTDISKLFFSHLFNNSSQNGLYSLENIGKETDRIINKKETIPVLNHKYVQTVGFEYLQEELETTNALSLDNNYIDTAHSSLDVNDEEDDFKTTEALMCMALKISQQDLNFNSSDDFENENISDESDSAEFQSGSSLELQNEVNEIQNEFNEIQNEVNQSPNDEEAVNKSLKLLQSLVDIESDKCESQKKGLNETEDIPQNSIISEVTQINMSDKTNDIQNNSQKSKEKLQQISSTEETSNHLKRKIQQPEYENESKKIEKHKNKKFKKSKKVSTLLNDMNNLTLNISSSNGVQSDQNIELIEHDNVCCKTVKLFEDENTDITDINGFPVKSPLVSSKYIMLSKDLKIEPYTTDNSKFNEKEYPVAAYDSNTLPMKANYTSTFNCNDSNMEKSNTKSPSHSGLTMKTSDYKKLYEKDRKSLFSPDIIIRSNHSKDSIINHCTKNENNLTEKKDNCVVDKKAKTLKLKLKLKNLSAKKNNSSRNYGSKKKVMTHNITYNTETVSNDTPNSLDQKSSSSAIVENDRNTFKRPKNVRGINKNKINAVKNKNKGSRITKLSENISTIGDPKIHNTLPNSVISEHNSLPDWLKTKCILYNIKPSYVVLERF